MQGTKLFGDGIGLWLTSGGDHASHESRMGELHGVSPKFEGFGVVVDTFKNVGGASNHRDISVHVGDGRRSRVMGEEDHCKVSDVRVNNKEGNNNEGYSRMRIAYINYGNGKDSLTIEMDPMSRNEWKYCGKVENLGLPSGFIETATFGIAASTGELADVSNFFQPPFHPIIRLTGRLPPPSHVPSRRTTTSSRCKFTTMPMKEKICSSSNSGGS